MNLHEFKQTLSNEAPPAGLNAVLQAMWMEARGDWEAAHEAVQGIQGRSAAWVHAYLHRKEGDSSNAAYWYSRAGRGMSSVSFEKEWDDIVSGLLEANT